MNVHADIVETGVIPETLMKRRNQMRHTKSPFVKFTIFSTVMFFCLGVLASNMAMASDKKIKLKLTSSIAAKNSPPGDSMDAWADLIEKNSNGRIKVRVFYAGELGSQQEVFDQVLRGNVDLLLDWAITAYDQRLGLMNAPYLVKSWEDAHEILNPNGWLAKIYSGIYGDIGLKYFGPYPDGFGGVATRGKYATSIAEAKDKGIKVRSAAIFPLPETMRALGYQVIPVGWSESYTAIQTGVVDGSSNNPIFWSYEYFRDIIDYYVHTRHTFAFGDLTMNQEKWNELDAEDQKIIADAAAVISQKQFVDGRATDLAYRQKAIAAGIKYIEPSKEEVAEMEKACREKVWPLVEKAVGPEIMKAVKENRK